MTVETASRIDAAWRALAGVLDPEVPVLSVLDLGIVRGVEQRNDGALEVILTPTYSGCPAVEVIEQAVIDALQPLGAVRVRRQFAPAWTTDWISDDGKRKLREYGIAPPGHLVGEATIWVVRRVPCPPSARGRRRASAAAEARAPAARCRGSARSR